MTSVLLIEDDSLVRRSLELALGRHGWAVLPAQNGEEGLTLFEQEAPELVVLDLMLPGIDGLEVCRRLRERSQVPIIMLTARGEDLDVVGGLEAGADDYVVKPVQPAVLDARIRAVLRRSVSDPEGVRSHKGLRIDTEALTVTLKGEPVSLTPTELRLLLTLSRAPARVFTREQLLEDVWEHGYLGDSRLVDNAVMRLRAKLGENHNRPEYIQTVRGFGYRFGPV
ncbi:response regulator transcription factor [Streptomyces cheonanensis]|uniref:Response regulator transcription factor n=1 Tax=Streptomyces cheonanensis TaxID=312720 RepID=A0ABP5GEV1_9ACTN